MFFVTEALAMGAPGGPGDQGNPLMGMLPLVIMFAIFYFLLIRPQQKKQKQHREFLAALKGGDKVLTAGGIYGEITEVRGDTLTIEIAKDLTIKVNRSFISGPAEGDAKTPEVVGDTGGSK